MLLRERIACSRQTLDGTRRQRRVSATSLARPATRPAITTMNPIAQIATSAAVPESAGACWISVSAASPAGAAAELNAEPDPVTCELVDSTGISQFGSDDFQDRGDGGRGQRRGENQVSQRRRSPAKHAADEQPERGDDGRIDDAGNHGRHFSPSFLAFAIISAMRSIWSSVSLAPSPPRSAATAFSADPSKKVSTTWRSADFRAVWRATAGR